MKIVINVLKILSLVALAAAIPMPLIVAIASFAGIPRLSTILLILAISVLFGAALWLEFSAIANWRAASKANRKGEKVLSQKKSTGAGAASRGYAKAGGGNTAQRITVQSCDGR